MAITLFAIPIGGFNVIEGGHELSRVTSGFVCGLEQNIWFDNAKHNYVNFAI